MASTYPNGATAIATEPRVTDKRKVWFPRAAVTVKIHDASKVIGVAGHYGSLTLEFAGSLDGVTHVWAQDLLDVKSEDIKDKSRSRATSSPSREHSSTASAPPPRTRETSPPPAWSSASRARTSPSPVTSYFPEAQARTP